MKVVNFTDTYMPQNNGIASSLYALHHTKKPWKDLIIAPVEEDDTVSPPTIPWILAPRYSLSIYTHRFIELSRDADVIHAHTPYPMFYYAIHASKSLHLPLVSTFHTDPAAIFGSILPSGSILGRMASKAIWRYLVWLYNKSEVVIAVSKWIRDELIARGLERKVVVIPNGVDTRRFSGGVPSRQFREEYKIPEDKPMVLFMGRLEHKKDPETFLRAALRSRSDAVFVVAGSGTLQDKLRQLAGGDKRVVFTGFIPDELVPQAFAAADVYVLTSEMETQGIVLLEALASETACISTDVGMAREVIEPEYIIKQGDVVGLSRRIDYLLENEKKRKERAKRGRKLVEGRYSINYMIKSLSSLYQEVIEGSGVAGI